LCPEAVKIRGSGVFVYIVYIVCDDTGISRRIYGPSSIGSKVKMRVLGKVLVLEQKGAKFVIPDLYIDI
jgi:hypothetical protein